MNCTRKRPQPSKPTSLLPMQIKHAYPSIRVKKSTHSETSARRRSKQQRKRISTLSITDIDLPSNHQRNSRDAHEGSSKINPGNTASIHRHLYRKAIKIRVLPDLPSDPVHSRMTCIQTRAPLIAIVRPGAPHSRLSDPPWWLL
jgi:hypothetical protein